METNQPEVIKDAKQTLLEYVEANPVAAVVQALVLGFAVGMLIRLVEGSSETSREREPEIDVNRKPTLDEAKFHLGSLLLPFLWPAWKKARAVSGKSAETVRETVKQVKKADLGKQGRKHLKQAEAWAEREAVRLGKLGKKTKKDAETWAEREKERLAEVGKKTAKEVEEWVEEEAEHLVELGKKKARDVEDWVEKEVIPAAEVGWKRLARMFGL